MTLPRGGHDRAVVRGVGVVQAIMGAALMLRPAAAATWIAGAGGPAIPTGLARLLGSRLTAQAVAELARPTRGVALAGAAIDGSHALSMLLPFAYDRRYRRAALINATAATATAATLAIAARRGWADR